MFTGRWRGPDYQAEMRARIAEILGLNIPPSLVDTSTELMPEDLEGEDVQE